MNHGSHGLGLGRAAIDSTTTTAKEKAAWGGKQTVLMQPRFQLAVAEATALVESARVFFYGSAEALWEATLAGEEGGQGLRGRARLAASHAVRSSVLAVDLLHAALATSAIFKSHPLERQFRDIHAAAHVMVGPLTLEAAGRVELRLDPDFPLF